MLKSTLKPTLMLMIAITAAGGASATAMARDGSAPQVMVRYSDLDLNTASGRERLDTRVRFAIRSMCNIDERQPLRQRAMAQECVAQAHRSVEPQLAALLGGSSARFASEKPPVVAAP